MKHVEVLKRVFPFLENKQEAGATNKSENPTLKKSMQVSSVASGVASLPKHLSQRE